MIRTGVYVVEGDIGTRSEAEADNNFSPEAFKVIDGAHHVHAG